MRLQTNCLEFLVSGSLDGATANPIFQRADATQPTRPDPPGTDPENIYQFEVANLGLVDLDFPAEAVRPDGTVTRGNRYVTWTYVNAGSATGGAGSGINVVGFRPGSSSPILQEAIESLDGKAAVYLKRCIFVPHGSALQLGPNLVADPSERIIVRLGVFLPRTVNEEELIARACCCMTQYDTIADTCPNPPNPESLDPASINAPSSTPVDVIGTNFEFGDVVTIPPLTVSGTTFISSTRLRVTVTVDAGDAGQYDVIVTRPGVEDCVGILTPGLAVVVPG